MKISLPFDDIEKSFKSIFSFFFNPKDCLKINKKGELTIQDLSGYKIWFFLTVFQILILSVISATNKEFSLFFIGVILLFSLIRILLVSLIAYLVGLMFGIKDFNLSVGYFFILTAMISTIVLVLAIPAIDYIGYQNAFIHKTIPDDLIKDFPSHLLFLEIIKILVVLVGTYGFGTIVAEKIFNKKKRIILSWILISNIIYFVVFREKVVFYMSQMVESKIM